MWQRVDPFPPGASFLLASNLSFLPCPTSPAQSTHYFSSASARVWTGTQQCCIERSQCGLSASGTIMADSFQHSMIQFSMPKGRVLFSGFYTALPPSSATVTQRTAANGKPSIVWPQPQVLAHASWQVSWKTAFGCCYITHHQHILLQQK